MIQIDKVLKLPDLTYKDTFRTDDVYFIHYISKSAKIELTIMKNILDMVVYGYKIEAK